LKREQLEVAGPQRWMSGITPRRLGRNALALAALLAMVACGQTSSTQPATSTAPILIGQIASLTGPYQALGTQDKLGAALAVDEINKAGGVNGRQLQLLVEDDQTKADQGLIAYDKLVGEGVVAVIGSSFSNSSLAVIKSAVDKKKVSYISTAASDAQVDPVHPYAFMTPPTAASAAERLLQYMKAQGYTKAAVIHDTLNAFADSGWAAQQAKASKYGVSFVEEETYTTTSTDFTSQLAHLRAHPDVQAVMVWGTGPGPVILTKQYKANGIQVPLLMSHGEASSLYVKPAGAAAEGVIVATSLGAIASYVPSKNPAAKMGIAMTTAFNAANGSPPAQFAFDGYGAVLLIEAAIKAKSATASDIRSGLEQTAVTTPEGTYHYSRTNHYGLGLASIAITVVKGGNFVPTDFSTKLLAQGQ
jgi:branched-chain amino acid transport system substrate-binding protein